MDAITEREIRSCFVNCSKGEAHRAGLPQDLADRPWGDLDFLGWRDPGAPDRAYLVAGHGDRLTGIALRATAGGSRGFTARSLCSLCLTVHTSGGVVLMTARRGGEAGRQGNTVGRYLCADLSCSLYVRGMKAAVGGDFDESLTPEARIARTRVRLRAFLQEVTG
ncbi:FBP domain-containing protein [Spongiactinospora sp. TRM90649]|uniref:FBP domain-containing protein n=1 Tax=Spongiactinospora sp. TRM90649 TaxID=3031114 RepID=UPI0023F69568|nr:FBP domain-containing protein [Spongiactinospora sp. TRM90649]MDF5752194.1 FBP domain-containing protein [Spongiactinospora sp. TRM90649]